MVMRSVDVYYSKHRVSDLDDYNEKVMEKDELEDRTPPAKPYKGKPITKNIIKVNRQENVSPILKKLITSEQSTDLRPLKTIGSEVVGGLFDRVKFLRHRITETKATMQERKEMNDRFNKDIDGDIEEMKTVIPTISDMEQLRQFKINLNLLKMEKRRENNLFWKDMVGLKTQLRELSEKLEVESKIAELFSDLHTVG